MRLLLAAAVCALAACSQPEPSNPAAADVNGAAEAAQGDIDTYAANRLASAPPVAPKPTPASGPVPVRSPRSPDAPVAADDATGAVAVVERYFALLGTGRYDQAWALWGDGGRASGMTRAAFAAGFAKYADYRAEIGAPGEIEAGAGQRYVTVPVRAYGMLADRGQPFELRGTVTLHRTAVDGATAEQRAWRISDSSLKPRPRAAAAATPGYACDGATRTSMRTDDGAIWHRDDGGDAPARCTVAAN